MTPYQELAVYGRTVLEWDWGLEVGNYSIERIPPSTIYTHPAGNRVTRDAYRVARARLRVGDFYATRVVGDTVIKILCSCRHVSEAHGFIYDPTYFRRLGLTMLLVKDDDPCSNKVLSQQLEDASRVTGWKKDAEGIMRPVYATMKEQV